VLREANLRHSSLFEASFRDADLNGADLSEADVANTDFRGADLRNVNLAAIQNWEGLTKELQGANVRDVRNAPSAFREHALANGAVED